MRWLDGITNSMDMSLSMLWDWWWTGKSGVLQSMGLQRVRQDWVTELNWELVFLLYNHILYIVSFSYSSDKVPSIFLSQRPYYLFLTVSYILRSKAERHTHTHTQKHLAALFIFAFQTKTSAALTAFLLNQVFTVLFFSPLTRYTIGLQHSFGFKLLEEKKWSLHVTLNSIA